MFHQRISKYLFLLILIASSVAPSGIASILLFSICFALMIDPLGGGDLYFLIYYWPLFIIFFTGLHGLGLFALYDVLKDGWFVLNPLSALITGSLLIQQIGKLEIIFKIIIFAATCVALIHISKFINHPELLKEDYTIIRQVAGHGYYLVMIGFSILVVSRFRFPELINLSKIQLTIIGIILAVSLILSFSRTFTLNFFILVCILLIKKNIKISLERTKKYMPLLLIFFVGLSICLCFNLNISHNNFTKKILNSYEEIIMQDYHTIEDINNFYRGYESSRGFQAFLSGNFINIVSGKGFGYLTDIGLYIQLADKKFRYIPVFHNGFIYLLVKTGIIGLSFYVIFFFLLGRYGFQTCKSRQNGNKIKGRIIIGLLVILAINTYTISGIFNSTAIGVLIILGAFVSYNPKREI